MPEVSPPPRSHTPTADTQPLKRPAQPRVAEQGPKAAPIDLSGHTPAREETRHTIVPGDTLIGIAKRYGVTLQDLMKANAGVVPTKLIPGRFITLPEGATPPATTSQSTPATVTGSEARSESKRSQNTLATGPDTPIRTGSPAPKLDGPLETRIEATVKRLRAEGEKLTTRDTTAWYVYDLKNGRELASINHQQQKALASMVKPFVAAAYFKLVEEGKLTYDDEAKGKLESMIRESNNYSTNWFIDKVGGPKAVESILKRSYPQFSSSLDIVQKIPVPSGAEYRNRGSAEDCGRLLAAIYRDEIAGSAEIGRAMRLPNRDRLVDGTAGRVPQSTSVTHKTGSTARLIGDMGVLRFNGSDGTTFPVAIVGMVSREESAPNYKAFMRRAGDVIREVSVTTYEYLKEQGKVQ